MEGIFKLGILLRVMDMVSGPVMQISRSIDTLHVKAEKLQPVFDKFRDYGKWIAGAGAVMTVGIGAAIVASASLEQAQRRLKTTIMDENGQVGKEFAQMTALAQKLGTAMAGTNKDMVDMFAALMKQGVSAKQIVTGLGEATAKLATVLEIPYVEAAVHVAKFSHSLGIADQDMIKFMDTVQRVSFASGVTAGDLAYTFKHLGGSLKLVGMQGLDSAQDISAMIGMLARAGIEGETAGSAIAMGIARMAEMTHRMDRAQIKKLLGPILDPKGIKLEFFTDAGAFKGIRPMIAELEKLKPLTEKDRMLVLEKLFRAGSGSMSTIGNLAMQGVQGFDAMVDRMKHMASLQEKINELNKGTMNLWKIMSGTFKNLYMTTGATFNELLHIHGILPKLNTLFGNIDNWITNHKRLASAIGAVVIGGTALLLVAGGLLLAGGLLGTIITKAILGLGALCTVLGLTNVSLTGTIVRVRALTVSSICTWLASVTTAVRALSAASMWAWLTNAVTGFRAWATAISVGTLPAIMRLTKAVWALNIACMTNPLAWIPALIIAAVAGFMWLYKHIAKVKTSVDLLFFALGYYLGLAVKGWKSLIGWILEPFRLLLELIGKIAPEVRKAFKGAYDALPDIAKGLKTSATIMVTGHPPVEPPPGPQLPQKSHGREGWEYGKDKRPNIKIMNLELPGVKDSSDFIKQLQMLTEGHYAN